MPNPHDKKSLSERDICTQYISLYECLRRQCEAEFPFLFRELGQNEMQPPERLSENP